MKQLFTIISSILLFSNLSAQTATSTANGNWINPTNWDCFCVPLPGYTVIINHAITLDTDFGYTTGSITVNAGGSLIEDTTPRNMAVGGSGFTNHGITNFFGLLNTSTFNNSSTGNLTLSSFLNNANFDNQGTVPALDSFLNNGTMTNSGTINVSSFYNNSTLTHSGLMNVDSFYNAGVVTSTGDLDVSSFYNENEFQNYKNIFQMVNGTIAQTDSFTNEGIMVNHPGAYINIDSVLNWRGGIFTNHNVMNFGDFTNLATFYNHDSLIGTRSFWNDGMFNNMANSLMTLGESFYNGDSITGLQTSHFINNGRVTVDNSWFSTDTISGSNTGRFTIQNITTSTGPMIGSFDFCDLTPTLNAPYIDFYIGFVDPNITYCTNTSIYTVKHTSKINLYPNPVHSVLTIEHETTKELDLLLYNALGQLVLEQHITDALSNIEFYHLHSGVYLVQILDKEQRIIQSTKIVKQN
jgi:hypothetical protein